MTAKEFIFNYANCGYGSGKDAKEYVKEHKKETYDTDDIIRLYQDSKKPNRGERKCYGMKYIRNGRTTAYNHIGSSDLAKGYF